MAVNTTSSSLLVRVKAKDGEAWRGFVCLYGPLVHRWCIGFGLEHEDAADVAQDVFRTVAESLASFQSDGTGNSFRAWLKTITRTRVVDQNRRNQHETVGVGGSSALARVMAIVDVQSALDSSDIEDEKFIERRVIDSVLDSCEEATRQAFLRVVVGGQHPANVALDLGMTSNAVYVAKSRILRKIREEFAQLVDL